MVYSSGLAFFLSMFACVLLVILLSLAYGRWINRPYRAKRIKLRTPDCDPFSSEYI